MLRRVAHGSARDGTLERLIRLLAIAGLTMRDPEDAADLAPWVGQVLEESIQEVRREMDREARENRAYHGHDDVANLALDVLGAMGSHVGPAALIVADVATGPPLLYDPVEDYDLRIEAQLALERIGKAAVAE